MKVPDVLSRCWQEIGRNIYTLRDVVDEIRDKPTRRSLAFLPYQLHFREPHPEHIRHGEPAPSPRTSVQNRLRVC